VTLLDAAQKRSGPRVEVIVKVEYESVGQLRTDFVSNLGEGGMFVRTTVPFSVGQVFQVQLSLPGHFEPPVTVDAEVRWTAADRPDFARGVGVAFRGLPAGVQQKLAKLLAVALPVATAPASVAHAPPGPTRVLVLATNAILRDIIRGELERLARGGAHHAPMLLALACPPTITDCLGALHRDQADAVVVDADGLQHETCALVHTLRAAARARDLPLVVMQTGEPKPQDSGGDRHCMVLRKPVSMKSLYTTLLALSSRRKVP
jgi:uncharacterized protein (TIGR02266 family)